MPKFFEKDGVTFMEVIPVKSLFHSGMVHDVVTSGRKFVVNMNTGELTINTREKTKVEKMVATNRPYYKPDGEPSIRISEDLDVALIQLRDQYNVKKHLGNFYYGQPPHRYTIRSLGNWKTFSQHIVDLYEGFV